MSSRARALSFFLGLAFLAVWVLGFAQRQYEVVVIDVQTRGSKAVWVFQQPSGEVFRGTCAGCDLARGGSYTIRCAWQGCGNSALVWECER